MQIVIIGSTGLVGTEFIKLLENYGIDNISLIFVGSYKSKNLIIKFNNITNNIITLDDINYKNNYIYINCADSEQAKVISEKMSDKSILIDNSSFFRLNENVPLVIPEINFPKELHRIYANPNCSTIILNLLMKPFIDNFGIKRVIVSTYQAASGAGKEGLEELLTQTKEITNSNELTTKFWKKQYIHNAFVHNSAISDNNYNEEECKIINETNKIFKDYGNIPITATCIRIPVLRSHCESVNIELEKETTYEEIIQILKGCNYLEILDNKNEKIFPESITSTNNVKVQVGHIRKDSSIKNGFGWNFWISGDQLLRGAAYNAFLILDAIRNNI